MEPTRQFSPMFHGTARRDYKVGDIVPARPATYGMGAYASRHLEEARGYAHPYGSPATENRTGQLSLFGTVYKVAPIEGDKTYRVNAQGHHFSEKGFRVTGVAEHVIPWEQDQLIANRKAAAEAAAKPVVDNPDER